MNIIFHAPIWVWVLLVVLVLRGVRALQEREISLGRLFLLPSIFLIWGGYALGVDTDISPIALLSGIGGLVIGAMVGWICWRASAPLRPAAVPGCVIRPGSVLPLCFILVAFVSRFALTAGLHVHPDWLNDARWMVLLGVWSGAVDGVFWVGSSNLLWRYRRFLVAPVSNTVEKSS